MADNLGVAGIAAAVGTALGSAIVAGLKGAKAADIRAAVDEAKADAKRLVDALEAELRAEIDRRIRELRETFAAPSRPDFDAEALKSTTADNKNLIQELLRRVAEVERKFSDFESSQSKFRERLAGNLGRLSTLFEERHGRRSGRAHSSRDDRGSDG